MTEYTLALALEDFIPVIFSTIGLYLISQMVGRVSAPLGQMAAVGWIFITIGGFLKATWKLVMALTQTQTNLVWFDKGMFIWMAIGFTCIALAVWQMNRIVRGYQPSQRPWFLPVVVLGLTLFAILMTGFPNTEINTWRFVLLGVMTIGNVVLAVQLIQHARRLKLNQVAWLFVANLVIIFILSGLARIPEQTIPLQWTEQLLNTFAQGAFAYAAWRLVRASAVAAPNYGGELAYE